MIKWIGAFLGAMNGGIIGALAGYAIGSFFDSIVKSDGSGAATGMGGGHSTFSGGQYSTGGYNATGSSYDANGDRNGFLFTLLVLSAHIIQADGKIMHSEMELVRNYLRQSFGEGAAQQGNDILLRLFEYRKQKGERYWQEEMEEAYVQVSNNMQEEYRIQLLAFLADIAKIDGNVAEAEYRELRKISQSIGIDPNVIDQMLSMGGESLDDAYKALGISSDATDDEVRRAYKKMALKYHPDRVATLGADVREAAQKKFQEINNAKERIYKARNL